MITQDIIIELRNMGLSDSDIVRELAKIGEVVTQPTIWRQRTKRTHSFLYDNLIKVLKKHRRLQKDIKQG